MTENSLIIPMLNIIPFDPIVADEPVALNFEILDKNDLEVDPGIVIKFDNRHGTIHIKLKKIEQSINKKLVDTNKLLVLGRLKAGVYNIVCEDKIMEYIKFNVFDSVKLVTLNSVFTVITASPHKENADIKITHPDFLELILNVQIPFSVDSENTYNLIQFKAKAIGSGIIECSSYGNQLSHHYVISK
jgi:hypothetical protein